MRTIEINPHEKFPPPLPGLTTPKVLDALKYLTLWGFHQDTWHKFSHVSINLCHDGEITAYYSRAKNEPHGMLMVAVWRHHEQEYTFHT